MRMKQPLLVLVSLFAAILCLMLVASTIFRSCTSDESPRNGLVEVGNMIMLPPIDHYQTGSRDHPPVAHVSIEAFYICKWEVTQALFDAVMSREFAPATRDNITGHGEPIRDVSWVDAVKFCNEYSRQSGLESCYDETTHRCDRSKNGYRLPTSAEWEYACRGNATSIYFWGNDKDSDAVYCVANGVSRPEPVGSKKPNPRSLYDITGNVSEWCDDKHPNNEKWHVYRGGSYEDTNWESFECKWSAGMQQGEHWHTVGFRVVRTAN